MGSPANASKKVAEIHGRTPYCRTDPTRVSVYVPISGRFYHTTDGGESFLIGR
jgi:hypothetical protein